MRSSDEPLNPPPHPITVYASHPPLPTTTRHSLPGGALPPYRGRSFTGRIASALPDAPEPEVRIHFPPAESPQTIGSSAAERDLRSARDEPALRRRIRKPCGSRAVDAARIENPWRTRWVTSSSISAAGRRRPGSSPCIKSNALARVHGGDAPDGPNDRRRTLPPSFGRATGRSDAAERFHHCARPWRAGVRAQALAMRVGSSGSCRLAVASIPRPAERSRSDEARLQCEGAVTC